MDIVLNGKPQWIDLTWSLRDLIESLGLAGKRYAVEVNMTIVPRSLLAEYRLSPGDRVEVVHAIGGG